MPTGPTSGRRGRTEECLKSVVTMPLPYSPPRSYERIPELPFSDQLSLTGCVQVNHPGGHWLAGLCVSGPEYRARLELARLELTCCQGARVEHERVWRRQEGRG